MHKGPSGGFPALKKLDQAEDAGAESLGNFTDDLTSVVSLARILVQKGDKEGAEVVAKARLLGWKEELSEEDSVISKRMI